MSKTNNSTRNPDYIVFKVYTELFTVSRKDLRLLPITKTSTLLQPVSAALQKLQSYPSFSPTLFAALSL